MFNYIFPIIIIVSSNVLYNICQKSTPQKANSMVALFVTYIISAIIVLIAFPFFKNEKGFFQSFEDLNWTSILLGLAIVGLEFGYLLAYRAGWNISVGSLVANIGLAIMLIPVGIIFYSESFNFNKIVGVMLCIAGLFFINKR